MPCSTNLFSRSLLRKEIEPVRPLSPYNMGTRCAQSRALQGSSARQMSDRNADSDIRKWACSLPPQLYMRAACMQADTLLDSTACALPVYVMLARCAALSMQWTRERTPLALLIHKCASGIPLQGRRALPMSGSLNLSPFVARQIWRRRGVSPLHCRAHRLQRREPL